MYIPALDHGHGLRPHQLGDPVKVSDLCHFRGDWADWRGYVCALEVKAGGKLNVTVSEEWPPQSGVTDGWDAEDLVYDLERRPRRAEPEMSAETLLRKMASTDDLHTIAAYPPLTDDELATIPETLRDRLLVQCWRTVAAAIRRAAEAHAVG